MGLLTEDNQQKIHDTSLVIAGCGVGSIIAISAVRLGFENLTLIDGDTIEISNTNRQGYTTKDVGKLKVSALASRLKQINPHVKIKKYPVFVDLKNAKKIASEGDIIIDSIDPDAGNVVIAFHREAHKQGKTVIQPTDVGWGAMVLVFSPESISYDKLIGISPNKDAKDISSEESFGAFVNYFVKVMPPYVQRIAMDVVENKLTHYPQPVTAAYTLASMTVLAAKRVALGLPVKLAPDYAMFDPNESLTPDDKKYTK